MLMNCMGVQTLQFVLSAGQKCARTVATESTTPTCRKFMMRKNSSRKAGATRRRSRRSLLTPAKGTSGGIQCSRKR
uniref:Uncharacterized protein n=1 Tax=Prolemur simus TaxID=1328070 RepID=A0A8C8ZAC0_PROSS